MSREPEIVWMIEERTFGWLIVMGSFYSTIKYKKEGIEVIDDISNDEWRFIHDYEG